MFNKIIPTESCTVKSLLNLATKELGKNNIEDPKHNIDLMAAKALNITSSRLPLYWSEKATKEFVATMNSMVERRCNKEPLQYILGEWSFLELDVNVGPGVLIPRPETEEVFLAAVDAIKASNSICQDFEYADIGTGTGILGLAMATYFPKAKGKLVDISDKALEIAKSNLDRYKDLKCRVDIIKSDLLEVFENDSLDVILSNPPYIDSYEVTTLMPEVVNYEPHMALDGGQGGLVLVHKLLKQATKVLRNNGIFVFEHGHGQRKAINELLEPCWKVLKEGNDFADKERYFVLQLIKE